MCNMLTINDKGTKSMSFFFNCFHCWFWTRKYCWLNCCYEELYFICYKVSGSANTSSRSCCAPVDKMLEKFLWTCSFSVKFLAYIFNFTKMDTPSEVDIFQRFWLQIENSYLVEQSSWEHLSIVANVNM